jgi:hypothetical protein
MDFIITTYFTSEKDPQRPHMWANDDFSIIKNFYDSVVKHNLNCIILIDNSSDEFIKKYQTDKITFVRCDSIGLNVVDVRWGLYKKLLINRPDILRAFFVDVSDVVILKNAFNFIESEKIYCGDEEIINSDNKWMVHRYALINHPEINTLNSNYINKKVLNAGILGGSRDYLLDITDKISEILDYSKIKTTTVDMCVFNHVIYTNYENNVVHGKPVNTIFRTNDVNNNVAWFKHK